VINLSDNSKLELHAAMTAICGALMRGYKLAEINVPFPHFRADIFSARRVPPTAARAAGIAILLTALLFFPVRAVHAESLSLEQLIAKTQEIYDKTTDLRAQFTQEVTIKSMKKTEREEGTVTFKNPKMMLWDYTKPKDKRLVINDQKAWLYVPEDRMVYIQNADDVYRSRTAVKFLSGLGKLSADFLIRFTRENPINEEGNYLLTLTAKEAGTGIDRLHLTVDGKTFQILQCRFNDSFGNTTRLRFSDIRTNTGVSEKLFTFKTPPGVEVVSVPQ
jgi:outer membrane lipoprotein carrier protein